MEFSYNPVNPFQDDGLSKEDRVMIDGMRNTAYVCGYSGEDIEFIVHKALKRMGRHDLLTPCDKKPSWLGKNCKDCGNEKCKKLGTLPKGYSCALWQPKSEGIK